MDFNVIMGLQYTQVFTDNQFANCTNAANPSDAPDWSTKPFSYSIVAFLTGSSRVHNIPRAQNQMVDLVATSVFPHYAVIWDILMGALFCVHSS
jgi:hypothetical protein